MTATSPPPTRPPENIRDQGFWLRLLNAIYLMWEKLNRDKLDPIKDATNGGNDDLTEIEFFGISRDVTRIVVILESVSLSAADDILVQIGDDDGFETTGYDSGSAVGSGSDSSSTSGFVIAAGAGGTTLTGTMTVNMFDRPNNKWVSTHSVHREDVNDEHAGAGHKTLSKPLDRVRVKSSGSDTFDNGNINVLLE